MVGWQRCQRIPHHENGGIVLAQAQFPEYPLQHLDTDAAVFCIEHNRHHALRTKALRQCLHTRRRICEMVQHAG